MFKKVDCSRIWCFTCSFLSYGIEDRICMRYTNEGAAINGRRLALYGGTVTLRYHRNPQGNLQKGGLKPMLTIEGLIAVLSLCLTAFGLGYAIGGKDNDKIQK